MGVYKSKVVMVHTSFPGYVDENVLHLFLSKSKGLDTQILQNMVEGSATEEIPRYIL